MEDLKFIFKNGILNKPKHLVISDNFITLNTIGSTAENILLLKKEGVLAYQFGIRWYEFYFVFGRNYVIRITYSDLSVTKINFRSYFGYQRQKKADLYCDIVDGLWEKHFKNITDKRIKEFHTGISFEVNKVIFSAEGITIMKSLSFKEDIFLALGKRTDQKLLWLFRNLFDRKSWYFKFYV